MVGVAGLVVTCIITGLIGHRQAAELRSLAQTDPLTGLRNHRGFHESLELELALARRENEQLSLVTIDLDDFKAVNDAHGHPYGDEVLRGVGSQLRSSVREGDTAARVGGEEFALILPGTPSDAAYSIAERARAGISRVRGSRAGAFLLGGGRHLSRRRRGRVNALSARRRRPVLGQVRRQAADAALRPPAREADAEPAAER